MLTGYNTDVFYEGETFHVQTEDKGLKTPIILSLVYRAGTILAAKRTSYDNFIKDGVIDEAAVAQMLSKQHQLLVAAIKSGKSEKLAAMSRQQSDAKSDAPKPTEMPAAPSTTAQKDETPNERSSSVVTPVVAVATVTPEVKAAPSPVIDVAPVAPSPAVPVVEAIPLPTVESIKVEAIAEMPQIGKVAVQNIRLDSSAVVPENRTSPKPTPAKTEGVEVTELFETTNFDGNIPSFDQIISGYLQTTKSVDQLRIEMLYPSKFTAGDEVTVRAAILYGGHSPASNVIVKLQILGTRIDPQNLSAKTDFQGLVSFNVKIPNFSTGAAALVLTVKEANGQETEAKYMIRKK